ncbi:MAG: S41 family peptidase [Proteobacteria bacterium]|nr:S41 family peptidase [Pseudomonadota bacterium]
MQFTAGRRTTLALTCGVILGVCAALTAGALADRQALPARPPEGGLVPGREGRAFAEVYARIKTEYVDEVDDHALMEKAIRGMVAALDPHSAYLDSSQLEEVRLSTMGAYPGVGIEVGGTGTAVRILKIMEGSPAQQAGLQANDQVVAIDGTEVGADLAGALARLRGPAGTPLHLSIRRSTSPATLEFELTRTRVEVHSVTAQLLEPGYGYVRISTFSGTTPGDLRNAVLRLKRDNHGDLAGLMLDLRNNPGGVLEAGVAVADAFLESGVIVTADGRTEDARFEMDATPGDLIDGAPLVVLVNAGSASASEIVAGALKDHGRALLIGRRTYGKGSVQTVMPLAHGGAVKLTTSRYFTPSGASIHGRGLTPDILEEGAGAAPAELPAAGEAPLAARDADVRLALKTLQQRTAPRPASPAARPGVP